VVLYVLICVIVKKLSNSKYYLLCLSVDFFRRARY